jgi:hypothetical protein
MHDYRAVNRSEKVLVTGRNVRELSGTLRTHCGHAASPNIQVSTNPLISMVGAQGLEPWTR